MDDAGHGEWVPRLAQGCIGLWRESACDLPERGRPFSRKERRSRERAYDEALCGLETELTSAQASDLSYAEMERRLVARFSEFSASALDLPAEMIDILTTGFIPAGVTLAKRARRFDPSLPMAGIVQACRNAWTACGLQPLLGADIAITPSILAYSLLYPYSDNCLDDRRMPLSEKMRFSARFRGMLQGRAVPDLTGAEVVIRDLVHMIETEFPRREYPFVFECLLAIHGAQERSVTQVSRKERWSEDELLRISCEKGGTSVVADACLARGRLRPEELRFAFEWGVLLQLGDDLQDVAEDLRHGSSTLFSCAAAAGQPLDSLAIQLLNFSARVGTRMDGLTSGSVTLKNLLKMSWGSLIVRAVADSREYFSAAFVRESERISPFRFDFLRERQRRLTASQGVYDRLFKTLLDTPEPREAVA